MRSKNKPIARVNDVVVQDSENEMLIYDLKNNKAFHLDETATLIWKMCDGKKTISDISIEMSKHMKTLVSEEIVWLGIDKLKKDNLVINAQEIETKFNGLSRREVIRNIGLTTLAAIPIISSIVAPAAAQTGSCPPISNCSSPTGKCPGCSCNTTSGGDPSVCFSGSCSPAPFIGPACD